LTASKSIPSSDAASFDPVSLTTPTYSIADLQALFSQVQALSSSASNSALSVTPDISSEWFLDSACCNHMTDNPHLTSAHTPPVLPTITTADGSAMTVSHVGSISTPNLSSSDTILKTESLCIILYIKCNTRESLYIGRGKSNAQVKGVLYKTMYWA
jgi:hypothetical protein